MENPIYKFLLLFCFVLIYSSCDEGMSIDNMSAPMEESRNSHIKIRLVNCLSPDCRESETLLDPVNFSLHKFEKGTDELGDKMITLTSDAEGMIAFNQVEEEKVYLVGKFLEQQYKMILELRRNSTLQLIVPFSEFCDLVENELVNCN